MTPSNPFGKRNRDQQKAAENAPGPDGAERSGAGQTGGSHAVGAVRASTAPEAGLTPQVDSVVARPRGDGAPTSTRAAEGAPSARDAAVTVPGATAAKPATPSGATPAQPATAAGATPTKPAVSPPAAPATPATATGVTPAKPTTPSGAAPAKPVTPSGAAPAKPTTPPTAPASTKGAIVDSHRAMSTTRAAAAWFATAVSLVILVLLIILILENQETVEVRYLGLQGSLPLGTALLIAAVAGGAIVTIVGVVRLTQLRIMARRARRREHEIAKRD
ncbi:lipopolysaccharide assembly protein LapA domain-containing protein [Actinotalea sp.]|uniref:lipopolysaccharide assembly protein LapA domain-containing protein n=1 Tax=Actinotalea sp. TaxID=1872145 RepID=UPI003567C548